MEPSSPVTGPSRPPAEPSPAAAVQITTPPRMLKPSARQMQFQRETDARAKAAQQAKAAQPGTVAQSGKVARPVKAARPAMNPSLPVIKEAQSNSTLVQLEALGRNVKKGGFAILGTLAVIAGCVLTAPFKILSIVAVHLGAKLGSLASFSSYPSAHESYVHRGAIMLSFLPDTLDFLFSSIGRVGIALLEKAGSDPELIEKGRSYFEGSSSGYTNIFAKALAGELVWTPTDKDMAYRGAIFTPADIEWMRKELYQS
jgi:hypothetical protein